MRTRRVSLTPAPGKLTTALSRFSNRGRGRRLLKTTLVASLRHGTPLSASAMAFDLFLACVPMFALAGWLMSFVVRHRPEAIDTLSAVIELAPDQVRAIVQQQVVRFDSGVAPLVLAGALWIASGAFHTGMDLCERAHGARPRKWFGKRLLALGCVATLLVTLGVASVVLVHAEGGATELLYSVDSETLTRGGRHWVALIVAYFALTVLLAAFFRIAVSRGGRPRRVWPGAFATMTLGAGTSWLFATYVQTLGRYSAYYGSLAAVAVVLVWLWVSSAALLLGAELNAALERDVEWGHS